MNTKWVQWQLQQLGAWVGVLDLPHNWEFNKTFQKTTLLITKPIDIWITHYKRKKDVQKQIKKFENALNLAGKVCSCLFKIIKLRYKNLVDTGVDSSLISKRMYDKLQNKTKLTKLGEVVIVANGESLASIGQITFSVINGLLLQQVF